jgi:hypothetical protein
MAIVYGKTTFRFEGIIGVEDAEALLEKLQEQPKVKLNLLNCQHLHTAILQLLILSKPTISVLPSDKLLSDILTKSMHS